MSNKYKNKSKNDLFFILKLWLTMKIVKKFNDFKISYLFWSSSRESLNKINDYQYKLISVSKFSDDKWIVWKLFD